MTTSIKITKNSSLNPPQDSSVYEKVPTISDPLSTAGWIKSNTGESSAINYNYRFDLYIRRRNLWEMMSGNDDISKISSAKSLNTNEKIPDKSNTFPTNPGSVSNPSMGMHKCDLTPSDWVPASEALPVLSSFVNYPSLAAIRTNKPVIVIAYNSEWFYCDPKNESDRHMLT